MRSADEETFVRFPKLERHSHGFPFHGMKNEAGERLILNEEVRSEEVKTCLLCGATGKAVYMEMRDRLFNAPGKWNIMRCPGCGLLWLDPRPTREDNHKVYLNYFTHEEDGKLKPIASSPLKKIKYYIIASYFGYNQFLDGPASRLMGKLSGLPPFVRERAGRKVMWLESCNRGKLLDIGCGQGKFLARMHNFGWDVSGVEPDAETMGHRHFGCSWFPLDPPRHLHLFSMSTLRAR